MIGYTKEKIYESNVIRFVKSHLYLSFVYCTNKTDCSKHNRVHEIICIERKKPKK